MAKKILVKYESTNSGGDWWLKDKDWKALEKVGWKVEWFKNDSYYNKQLDKEYRWLGALASAAKKKFKTIKDAIQEFEKITGQNTSDEGCNCCGAPHCFTWKEEGEHHYASGEGILQYLYDNVPGSLRDACERLESET